VQENNKEMLIKQSLPHRDVAIMIGPDDYITLRAYVESMTDMDERTLQSLATAFSQAVKKKKADSLPYMSNNVLVSAYKMSFIKGFCNVFLPDFKSKGITMPHADYLDNLWNGEEEFKARILAKREANSSARIKTMRDMVDKNREKIMCLSDGELIAMANGGKFPNAGGSLSIWGMDPDMAAIAFGELKEMGFSEEVFSSFAVVLKRMISRRRNDT